MSSGFGTDLLDNTVLDFAFECPYRSFVYSAHNEFTIPDHHIGIVRTPFFLAGITVRADLGCKLYTQVFWQNLAEDLLSCPVGLSVLIVTLQA